MNYNLFLLALLALAAHALGEVELSGGPIAKEETIQLPKKLDPFGWLKGNSELPAISGLESAQKTNILKATGLLGTITELLGTLLQTVRGLLTGLGGLGGLGK